MVVAVVTKLKWLRKIRRKQHSFRNGVHMHITLYFFGLCNVPPTFQKVVTKTFKPYLNILMQVFLDDSSVYGDKKDHLEQLQKCLEECRPNGINLNPKKCAFYVNSIALLGHIVSHDNLLVDPRRVTTIIVMPILTNPIEIKQILGMASFYRHYFRDFASKVAPMCKLLKKDEEFKWTVAYAKSWEWTKASMTCLLVLIVLNWNFKFHVHTTLQILL